MDDHVSNVGAGAGVSEARGPRTRKTILAVSSGGGHFMELLRLRPAFEGHHVIYATVDGAYRAHVGRAPLYVIRDATRWDKLALMQCAAQIALLIARHRPDVVITTGAAPGYFALVLGRRAGAKTVWVDSIANVEELSLSGKRAGAHADLWLTQWPELARAGGPEYRGAVL